MEIRTRRQGDAPFFPNMLNNADVEVCLKEDVDKVIAELKDKIQMHDFFWEGNGFDKLGFKNAIQVREEFDKLKPENLKLKAKNIELQSFYDLHGNDDNYIEELKAEKEKLKKDIDA